MDFLSKTYNHLEGGRSTASQFTHLPFKAMLLLRNSSSFKSYSTSNAYSWM